jgi:glycosyltransferase involved in cell wall biosynthesis
MRTGHNPAKSSLPAYQPQTLAVASLVYIPHTAGYFQDALRIFALQVNSLRANTGAPFDLLVFDNGSAPEVKTELLRMQQEGLIDHVISSRHNLGKTGAINWIFSSLPNELICYTDSDVFFRPGWFEASQALLNNFDRVGLVTAQPCFNNIIREEMSAHHALQNNPAYQVEEVEADPTAAEEYAHGIGANEELRAVIFQKRFVTLCNLQSRVQAVLGASHMQFLARRSVMQQVLPLPAAWALHRDEDRQLQLRIDQLKYLEISTLQPLVFHMGNQIDEAVQTAAHRLDQINSSNTAARMVKADKPALHLARRLAQHPRLRALMERAYHFLFQALQKH